MKPIYITILVSLFFSSCKNEKVENVTKETPVKTEVKDTKEAVLSVSSNIVNYENIDGSKTSLTDLKDKYVYIDVWATWCGPCRKEIPYLQKLEEKYHGKNIAFVSISLDEDKDKEKWKKMIADKKMGGIQLFADKNWESDFVKAYRINSIPRFIFIGPSGNVLNANAPRPSNGNGIKALFSDI